MKAISHIDKLDPRKYILIKGARVHNLKNVDVAIERNKLVVITGLSGSGKSSLAFDTLYSEGQRRYVESLSSYARQFLGRMHKPEVEYIKGISPAIAIQQKVNVRNPRSTVGTSTEIYEYLKLLYAKTGKTFSPVSGKEVKRHTVSHVVDEICGLDAGTTVIIYAPLEIKNGRTLEKQLNILLQQGFSRVLVNEKITRIEEVLPEIKNTEIKSQPAIVIDRFVKNGESGNDILTRIADSVQTAFFEGDGKCIVAAENNGEATRRSFSNKFELDGITFERPTVNFFAFNNPYGACKTCEGFGSIIGIDEDLIMPNKNLSVYDEAIACWKGEKMGKWKERLVSNAYKFDFPIHKPVRELTSEQKELLWTGNNYFHGLNDFFRMVEENTYKIQYRVMLSRYRGKTVCPDCKGTRLRKDASYVKVGGKSIIDLVMMPVDELKTFFEGLVLGKHEQQVAERLLTEINNRLNYLNDVGLGYLTLNRLSNTLSGGESQRINLATSLGSNLVGSLYILDEPSIGLHPRDTQRLVSVLERLRDLGNTVIVVEHEEEVINAAGQVIDIGPLAGSNGGEIIFQGSLDDLLKNKESYTARYLNRELKIDVPQRKRKWKEYIELKGVRQHNLKGFDVRIPLQIMVVVTGVSGSGKTSLVRDILYPSLKKILGGYAGKTGKFDSLEGDYDKVSDVVIVDQNPIGRSSRSNPATYLKVYDEVRALYASQPLAKTRNYKPGFFSFNIEGGRCPECEGEGEVNIEMQFMADIRLTCEVCKGKRFKDEMLDVTFEGLNISDLLNLTVDEAVDFFSKPSKGKSFPGKIIEKLKPLQDVGMGYVKMGQSSSTFSGGEAQRIKLASFLSKGMSKEKTLFIFDEPTTGLHFHDIKKLLAAFEALLENGHSIVVIEHNPEVIKSTDWIIDLGPEGGSSGGHLVFEGAPGDIVKSGESYTGLFLKKHL